MTQGWYFYLSGRKLMNTAPAEEKIDGDKQGDAAANDIDFDLE